MLLAEVGYEHRRHEAGISAIRNRLPLSISAVIEAVADLYCGLYNITIEEINCGMCEDFAEDVCSLVPGATALWNDEIEPESINDAAHKVVFYNDLYYDSEWPEGSKNWKEVVYK